MTQMMLTKFGTWRTKAEYLHDIMSIIGRDIVPCNEQCEAECVFKDIGTDAGCPINEFEDRVLEVIGQ